MSNRSARLAFSVLVVAHFVALVTSSLPRDRDGFSRLPEFLRIPLVATVPPVASALSKVTDPYIRILSLSQNWAFFAPDPLKETPVVGGLVFGRQAGASGEEWREERIVFPAPLDEGAPTLRRGREYYLLLNAASADAYPVLHRAVARWACQDVASRVTWTPEGVRLYAVWYPVVWPGTDPSEVESTPIDLGGFPCPDP